MRLYTNTFRMNLLFPDNINQEQLEHKTLKNNNTFNRSGKFN